MIMVNCECRGGGGGGWVDNENDMPSYHFKRGLLV